MFQKFCLQSRSVSENDSHVREPWICNGHDWYSWSAHHTYTHTSSIVIQTLFIKIITSIYKVPKICLEISNNYICYRHCVTIQFLTFFSDCSYGLVVGLSISVTFMVLSTLITLLLTCLYVRVKYMKATPTGPTHLYANPSTHSGKETLEMSPCAEYRQVNFQTTAPRSSNTYETYTYETMT